MSELLFIDRAEVEDRISEADRVGVADRAGISSEIKGLVPWPEPDEAEGEERFAVLERLEGGSDIGVDDERLPPGNAEVTGTEWPTGGIRSNPDAG
ncbi:unnamed protein product [Peronospora effusa]|nr:unnamed protein product [Peronospora effusa]